MRFRKEKGVSKLRHAWKRLASCMGIKCNLVVYWDGEECASVFERKRKERKT